MNQSSNPYEPPAESIDTKNAISIGNAISGVFAFCGIGFIVWLLVILTVFRNSSTYWPAFAALGPAILGGLLGAWIAFRSKSPFSIACALVATLVVLIILVLGMIDGRANLVPKNQIVAPVHWFLLFFSLAGFLFATINVLICFRRTRLSGRILPALLIMINLIYLVSWGLGISNSY